MALTNQQRVGKTLELLKDGLAPYVEREFENRYKDQALAEAQRYLYDSHLDGNKPISQWDSAALLKVMWNTWNEVFRDTLGPAERSMVKELQGTRNRWAHQDQFTSDDAYRAMDSAERLLVAVSAEQADDLDKMKMELLRVRFEEQLRTDKRREAKTAIESPVTGTLKPWREVVSPHPDVAGGQYQQAEFAADLWQVHIGQGTDEYRDPAEFFRRTYLTASLQTLLETGIKRLGAGSGDPVVQLQTNFGGGKTHSMLALYHLFSGTPATDMVGVEQMLAEAGGAKLPQANRVVLVGNKISPGRPEVKPDGTVVQTLWGELVWQLGYAAGGEVEARKAFDRIRADDERSTNPGDELRKLMDDYGPCLILIDEWVAYARQLHDEGDLPGGSFETHFSFAQALTESARAAKNCLLVISLPSSDSGGSPHAIADDVEVGGERGRAALNRLRNAVGRVDASWHPATAEEGFEIVRRRLFEPIATREQFVARDGVARAFADFYRANKQDFPPDAVEAEYEERLKSAYPIHPEVFDRLYNDWSTLVKFQRTRGVLRLMAAVINSLWEKGDRNPLIMPANISMDDKRVRFELTRYLDDNWPPVIEKDIDGPNALPRRIDDEVPNLGKLQACRRVARTIYLGSAPTVGAANRGLEDRRIRLGSVMPGESIAVFGDALRRMSSASTYLYQDGLRYWYSTTPTVTKLADDLAEQLKSDPDAVAEEIERRLRIDAQAKGDFAKVHPLPQGGQDVSDEMEARLVILGSDHPYSKAEGSPAEKSARVILNTRGASPRLFQNALVFAAPDDTRLQDLEDGVRRYLAWRSIIDDKERLDIAPNQLRQAEGQLDTADKTVAARLPGTYQWLLVPVQDNPGVEITFEAHKLGGEDPIAVRASKRLRSEELLIPALAGTRLRMELDNVPLWRGDHVSVRQLADDFARYVYLPRVARPAVIAEAVRNGLGVLLWEEDTFAYADSYDEEVGRYIGLRAGEVSVIPDDSPGLVVNPSIAKAQIDATTPPPQPPVGGGGVGSGGGDTEPPVHTPPPVHAAPKRFHGSVELSPDRTGRDAGRVADEVISHLNGLVGADVQVTLDIEAHIASGAPDNVVKVVTANARDLKFRNAGFEEE